MVANTVYEQMQAARIRMTAAQHEMEEYVTRMPVENKAESKFNLLYAAVQDCTQQYMLLVKRYLQEKYSGSRDEAEAKSA
jgi:hypothetical protein